MHRRITFHGEPKALRALAQEIQPLEGVIGLAYQAQGSLKPPGDLLQADVLNRDADEVLRRAGPHLDRDGAAITVVISQTTAMIERGHTDLIETDADEAMWEEMESDLRNHGRVSSNYLLLMALGGVIAAIGLFQQAVEQAIALVGASIIAPGFEPIAKLTQGLVLRRMRVCGRAIKSVAVGYGVLFGAAFLTIAVLSRAEPELYATLEGQPVLSSLTRLRPGPLLTSAGAAVAGILMVVSLRDFYVVGPLMVLVLISGVALMGAALAIGQPGLALGALRRTGADFGLLIVLGAAVFYWKQRRFHRRRPLT